MANPLNFFRCANRHQGRSWPETGLIRAVGPWFAAVSIALVALSLAAPAWGQEPARINLSLAEVLLIDGVREAVHARDGAAAAKAAYAYITAYPRGRYIDEATYMLGEALDQTGEYAAALSAYGRLIEKVRESPFREYAVSGSYKVLRQAGRRDEANARLKMLFDQYPRGITHTGTLLWEGSFVARAGEPKAVIEIVKKVDPDEIISRYDRATYDRLLGMAYVELGLRYEAEPYLRRYAAGDDLPKNKGPVLMFLATEAREKSQNSEALAYYQQIVDHYPNPPQMDEASYWNAELFNETRLKTAPPEQQELLRSDAIKRYTLHLEKGGETRLPLVLRRRAVLLGEAGRYPEAMADYDRLLEIDPGAANEAEVITGRAAILKNLGRGDEAIAALGAAAANEAIGQDERRGLLVETVRAHYEDGNCGEVLNLLQPLPVFGDGDQRKQAMFMRGFCLYRAEQWDKATWDLEYLVNDPKYLKSVWEPLIDSYRRSGYHSRLVHLVEERLQQGSIEANAEIYLLLAAGYESMGEPAQVIQTYERLREVDPGALDDLPVLVSMGKATEALGRPGEAAAHYEAALAARAPDAAAGESYREILRRLQGLYQRLGKWESLVALNANAGEMLTGAKDKAALAQAQRKAYMGWGRSEMEWGRFSQAAQQYEKAWEFVPRTSPQERLEVLALLGDAYRQGKQWAQGVVRFEEEMERAEDGLYRLRVSIALAEYYQSWAQSVERNRGIDDSVALYEKALIYLPEQQWEDRYRILLKLDPLYQRQGKVETLIRHLESMEPSVTDKVFKAELRRYRGRLHVIRALALAEQGEPELALAEVKKAEPLVSVDDWEGRSELILGKVRVMGVANRHEEQLDLLQRLGQQAPSGKERNRIRAAEIEVHIAWGARLEEQALPDEALAQYEAGRGKLKQEDWDSRRDITLAMVSLYRAKGDSEKQLALLSELVPLAPAGAQKVLLRAAIVEVYREWGEILAGEKKPNQALLKFHKAMELLDPSEWQARYKVAQFAGAIYQKRNDYRRLGAIYGDILPYVTDKRLAEQLGRYLGQIYFKWAEQTQAAGKVEHARRRFHRSFESYPAVDWETRLAVIKKLLPIYEAEKDFAPLLELYESLVPGLPDEGGRRTYSLFIGRLYWEKMEAEAEARKWIAPIDQGGNDDLSLEAGYVLGEIALRKKEYREAQQLLEGLVRRKLDKSKWRVPIHYDLAVAYHKSNDLKNALRHYRIVASAKDKAALRAYPRSIRRAKAQVKEIQQYLRATGGAAGANVTVPGGIKKPPVPPPKRR